MDIVGFLLPYPKQLVNGTLDESLAEREDGEFLAQVVAIDNAEFFDGMGGRAVLPPRANIAVGIPCAVLEYVLTGVDKNFVGKAHAYSPNILMYAPSPSSKLTPNLGSVPAI